MSVYKFAINGEEHDIQSPLTAGDGIDITNDVVSNTGVLSVNGQSGDVTVDTGEASSITITQPSIPAEGNIYYDATNDVVKVYNGTNWVEVGGGGDMSNYLAKNNTTAFTPSGDYNPATKKYVDDSVSGAVSKGTTAPSSSVEGQLWYDTTNDVLKVYNGTTWVEVGGGITNNTTGTTYTLQEEWVGEESQFNQLSNFGNIIYNVIE